MPPRESTRAFIGDQEVSVDDFTFLPNEPIAGDGSATTSPIGFLRRAGWTVVQRSSETGEVRKLCGSLGPSRAQNAMEGELEMHRHVIPHDFPIHVVVSKHSPLPSASTWYFVVASCR